MGDSILIVEDEPSLLEGLRDLMASRGFAVTSSTDGETALGWMLERSFDAVILDIMLPGMSGFEVLRQVREAKRMTPILLLTARASEEDKLEGFTRGADDYVTKPFSTSELVARVEALIRRCRRSPVTDKVTASGVTLDFARHEAHVGGEPKTLTAREVGILRYLFAHRDRTVSKHELLVEVWGYPDVNIETRTVENHIAKLRQKIEPDQERPTLIRTVRGEGYRFGGTLE